MLQDSEFSYSTTSGFTLGLEDVLAGNPMANSVFGEFRKFLLKVERSSENLEFYMWFINYEKRYYTVKDCGPEGFIPLRPPPIVNLLSLESPSREGYEVFMEIPEHLSKLQSAETSWTKGLFSLKKKSKPNFFCPSHFAFSQEIDIIVFLFLTSSSSLELNLPFKIKDLCFNQLKASTHPDVFRAVHQHVAVLLQASWATFIKKYQAK